MNIAYIKRTKISKSKISFILSALSTGYLQTYHTTLNPMWILPISSILWYLIGGLLKWVRFENALERTSQPFRNPVSVQGFCGRWFVGADQDEDDTTVSYGIKVRDCGSLGRLYSNHQLWVWYKVSEHLCFSQTFVLTDPTDDHCVRNVLCWPSIFTLLVITGTLKLPIL